MPPRSWQILSAIAALLLVATSAPGQEKPEWQRRIDAMNLPPNPKFKEPLAKAHAKLNQCINDAALKRFADNKSNSDVGEQACKACDRQIVEYGAIFADANKHRFWDITAEKAAEDERKHCTTFKSIGLFELRQKFDAEIVQRAPYGTFGEWSIEGRSHRSGLLTYALMGRGDNAKVLLEMVCTPATKSFSDRIVGPFKQSKDSVYVTYIVDEGPMKQTIGSSREGSIGLPGQERSADLLAMSMSAEASLRISVSGVAAKFDMTQFRQAHKQWNARCL